MNIELIKLFNCCTLPFTPRLTYLPDIYQPRMTTFCIATKINFQLKRPLLPNVTAYSKNPVVYMCVCILPYFNFILTM